MQFVSPEEAKQASGLRLTFVANAPSPWGEAVKGMLKTKDIPCTAALYMPGDPAANKALVEWTGEDSAPSAMYEDEAPRSGWAEILLLLERLQPEPSLIPADPEQRALMFGLSHEICGEMGLGWVLRLMMCDAAIDPNVDYPIPAEMGHYLGAKYGYRPGIGPEATKRAADILTLLSARLKAEQAQGNRFLMGEHVTALDFYWATFCALMKLLPPEQCKIMDVLRAAFEFPNPAIEQALDPALIEHRDFMYNEYLGLPMVLS